MRKRWILIALAVGLLAAAVTGGVALAWGGNGHGWGWGRGHDDNRLSALAGKVAGILGTDEQETADAIAQARQELRDEAKEAALTDLAGRVAETLGTDADETADAIEQVAGEMRSEALEAKLQDAIDDGRITEEQAQEYRDNADSYGGRARLLVQGRRLRGIRQPRRRGYRRGGRRGGRRYRAGPFRYKGRGAGSQAASRH